MPAIALLMKESLSWLIKVVTTPRNIEYTCFILKKPLIQFGTRSLQ